MTLRRRPTPLLFAAALLQLTGACRDKRSDVVVYGDHVPVIDRQGDPFVDSFAVREDNNDPLTRVFLKPVPGIKHPKGSSSWGLESWAKYVFLGNYDDKQGGVFQDIEDQRIGVFDSERQTFCQLDLDPSGTPNAGTQWLAVADPKARRTRLFFEGIAQEREGGLNAFAF